MTPHDLISRPGGYRLSEGVTATLEGLEFASPLMVTVEYFPYDISAIDEPVTITWTDAAERLQYRDGEPWCFWHNETDTGDAVVELASHPNCRELFLTLHRLAAILADDAEGFRVLHYAVHNLGKERRKVKYYRRTNMNDTSFSDYMRAKERTATARELRNYADILLEKRIMEQRMAELISQHEPAFSLGIDRKKLAVALFYVRTGRLPEAEHGES